MRLTVADLPRSMEFYERAIGLRQLAGSNGATSLGAGESALVELVEDVDAPPRPPRTTGLFHLAILVPDRLELARALFRVVDAGWSFTGASDHLVSESLYLSDPEGNGIEIYRDRPREEWSYTDGRLQMDTLPLDVDGVLAELRGDAGRPPEMPAATTIGHVHLNVAELAASERFYAELLGFEVTVRGYPGALFVAAGEYHHHLGLNVWMGPGAAPPPPRSRGLRCFELVLPDRDSLEAVVERLRAARLELEERPEGVLVPDPSRNPVLLRQPG